MNFFSFVRDRWDLLWFQSYQHFSLVVQCLVLATVIGLVLAVIAYRSRLWTGVADSGAALGLTIPSLALLGVLIASFSSGVWVSVMVLTFFGTMPILRNAIVGLRRIDPALVESARGMGLSRFATLVRLEIPLAWPVIMTGVRVSGQMLMGVAAIGAFVLGPGLGGFIFSGISRMGGANATNSIVAGTVGILILAVILDTLLNLLTRLTTSRGIRV